MPLVYQQNINESSVFGIWHIKEEESFFDLEGIDANHIHHPLKRLQHKAGRYLIKQLCRDFPLQAIEISSSKKPFLTSNAYQFSISHSGDYVAVLIDQSNNIGLDIERVGEKPNSLRTKFLHDVEIELLQQSGIDEHMLFTMAWAIKETVFKWYGKGGVDFKNHIQIAAIDFQQAQWRAKVIFSKEEKQQLTVNCFLFDNLCISYLIK